MIEEILSNYGVAPAVISVLAGVFVVFLVVAIAAYIYFAIALQTTAKKLKEKDTWLAWIPIANLVLLSRLAKMHWWPALLVIGLFIPILNFLASLGLMVFTIIWTWKICEARKQPGWFSLLVLIPLLGSIWQFILWGILAWSDKPLIK